MQTICLHENLSLALMLFFLLALRMRHVLACFMVLIALIQVIDVIDDLLVEHFCLFQACSYSPSCFSLEHGGCSSSWRNSKFRYRIL